MQDLNLVESWKYFAELIVDVTEKFVPVSKIPSDIQKRKPYLTQQCKDAIKINTGNGRRSNTVKQMKITVHTKRRETKLYLN